MEKNEMTVLNDSLGKIVQDNMIAVKITVSKEFYEQLKNVIPFTKNNDTATINVFGGIPFEVVDDPLAPPYSIEYEYKPFNINFFRAVGEETAHT